jgi:hypothetical protein
MRMSIINISGALGLFASIALCIPRPAAADANLVQPDWTFNIQSISVTAGAQFTNGPCCLAGPTTTVEPLLIDEDIGSGTFTQVIPTTPGQTYEETYQLTVGIGQEFSRGDLFAVSNGVAYLPSSAYINTGPGMWAPAPADFLQSPPANCGNADSNEFCGPLAFGNPADTSNGFQQVTQEQFLTTATGSSTTIEFAGACMACDFTIDDVRVVAVPESASLATMGVCAVGVMAWAGSRRRRQGMKA